jgi:hypothetical protein
MKIDDTARLNWWLLGFSDPVTVLNPSDVRGNIARVVSNATSRYE